EQHDDDQTQRPAARAGAKACARGRGVSARGYFFERHDRVRASCLVGVEARRGERDLRLVAHFVKVLRTLLHLFLASIRTEKPVRRGLKQERGRVTPKL